MQWGAASNESHVPTLLLLLRCIYLLSLLLRHTLFNHLREAWLCLASSQHVLFCWCLHNSALQLAHAQHAWAQLL